MNYELTKEDYQDIEELIEISKRIIDVYHRLSYLESNNLKDSNNFIQLQKVLNNLLEQEQEIYQDIDNDLFRNHAMLEYLVGEDTLSVSEILNFIISQNEEDLVISRVATRLYDMVIKLQFGIDDDAEEEEKYALDISEKMLYMLRLNGKLTEDIVNTILYILNDFLNNPRFNNIKNYLVNFKYFLSQIYGGIEKKFISNDFMIPEELYWTSKMGIEEEKVDRDYFLAFAKDDYSHKILVEQLIKSIDLYFEDIGQKYNFASAIIRNIIIRSCLLFLTEDAKERYREEVLDEIEGFSCVGNQEMEQILRDSLEHYEEDSRKVIEIQIKL